MPAWAVLAIACAAQFMVVLDVSIVNVALPSMRTSLHLSTNGLQWVVNAYTLTFAGFLLFGGRAADLFGRKKIFLIGLGIFTLASLVGGFSGNGTMIVAARAVQGLGGAILAPSTLSLLTTTYTEPRARARALGIWSATAGSGGAFGALAGGVLTDLISWRWVLFVNVPLGVLLFLAAGAALTESRGQVRNLRSLDIPGTLTVTAGLAALVYGIVSTDTHAWGSAQTVVTLAIAAALLGVFLVIELRSAQPMVPLRIFRLRALSAANGVGLIVGAAMFAMFFFLSLYLQQVLGYSALKAGLAFLPGSLAIIAGAQLSSRLVSRIGPRPLLCTGSVITAGGLAWLSRLPAEGSYVGHILGPSLVVSIGIGLMMVPLTVAATAGVDRSEAGLASGLINTTRQVGGAIGLAALATIATSRSTELLGAGPAQPTRAALAHAVSAGYDRALLVSAFIVLGAAVIALAIPRPAPHVPPAEPSSAADEVPVAVEVGGPPASPFDDRVGDPALATSTFPT